MTHIIRETSNPLASVEKAQHYHRAMELNLSIASASMRILTTSYLNIKCVSLKDHLQERAVKQILRKFVFPEQILILNDPDPNLDAMDVSLLTLLLLKTFPRQITGPDKSNIEGLRAKRNILAHVVQARLDDDTLFNQSSQMILAVSKAVDREHNVAMVKYINELRRRELVRTCSNGDVVKINNEMFMIKLVEAPNTEKAKRDNELLIKYGLTNWSRQLSRGLGVEEFLQILKSRGVISANEKRSFELAYSYEEQMQLLILHMVHMGTKDNLFELCRCLREISSQLADLIEGSNTDGDEIDQYLKEKETSAIRQVLEEALKEQRNESVPTEDVHIYVEAKLKGQFQFSVIRKCVLEEFPFAKNMTTDCSFLGVTWKAERSNRCQTINSSSTEEHTDLHNLSNEEFAEFIGNFFSKQNAVLVNVFRTAIMNESISATTYMKMTKEQMKRTFTPYLDPIKYGIGIEMSLQEIQQNIRHNIIEVNDIGDADAKLLRPFDLPLENKIYRCIVVRTATGNLLIPQHEFVCLPVDKQYSSHFIAKKVVRFATACINSRQNGTIHFGIEPLLNGFGKIVGIPITSLSHHDLNEDIARALAECFEENVSIAMRCVRPVQVVPVEDERMVIEVDVVPYSGHLSSDLLQIKYPPKGCQSRHCFMYGTNEILHVSPLKIADVQDACKQMLKQREYFEHDPLGNENRDTKKQSKLKALLTRGNKYVTEELLPIIISGKISGMPNEKDFRSKINIERAFTSAGLVLDFDSSIALRDKVEENKSSFLVRTAENLLHPCMQKNEKVDNSEPLPIWVYCNGNDDNADLIPMDLTDWMRERSDGVKNALSLMRHTIPKGRAILIFLVYDTPKQFQNPMFEIARDALLSSFRDECLVISDKEENVIYLKHEVTRMFGESAVDTCFHTGLDWAEISRVMNTVFRVNADVICKLPCSKGHFVEMTLMERDALKLTDIEIISGEQCTHDEEIMSDKDRRTIRTESQESFYRGGKVSWWNFYYTNQVGKRRLFDLHTKEIIEKLDNEKGEGLIEVQVIEHHPGAGGSTLGRHILWEFSQFKGYPHTAYRCCVVNTITEDTVNQIDKFRTFKDEDDTRPFIILIDNKSEENVILLRTRLHELAYKTATPGKLFCLIIIINRMSISYVKTKGKHLLKHELSPSEQNWFEDKFKDMEQKGDIDVKTLIAFNFMRNSFDEKYIHDTTRGIMQGISKKEIDVLKCLALISSYESDYSVPQNVFDKMMNEQYDIELITRQPFGIAHHIKELDRLAKFTRTTWNVQMTDAMQLLVIKRDYDNFYNSGVCIVSQLLAMAVLEHIMKNEEMSLEEVVDYVLNLVEDQSTEENPMSKRFVKIVCSLFKTRQLMDSEKGDAKLKFSDLILELEHPVENEDENDSRQRVLRVMQRCFDITDDAMVGQQLARFNIHIKQFDAAETAIKKSLCKRPQSSYLLDTYGQIFKSKMDNLLETCSVINSKIPDESAVAIVVLALKANRKFREGQVLAIKYDEDTNWSCFEMEVKTALNMLEKFSKFSCYGSRENFLSFLNETKFAVDRSSFANLMVLCPSLESIRAGNEYQRHVDTSLRSLEERFYQVKRQLYSVHTEKEVLLLKLRERFERCYGNPGMTSHYQFRYGIGLKPLQQAKKRNPDVLQRRVKEAEVNLRTTRLSEADERDLLVYLGTQIITLSNPAEGTEECVTVEYKKLLAYSTRLVKIQISAKTSERSYLESFLYYAMLHWPLRSRIALNCEDLSGPTTYQLFMEKWDVAFNNNFFLKTTDQIRKHKPKNYFALAKGTPGNDIVDLESIRKQWSDMKKDTGRKRKPVYRDNFWKESFVVEQLKRLDGTVDGTGHYIIHKVEYPQHGTRTFRISTFYPCDVFSNRAVTFVLGFTWKGPTAFDVDEKGRTGKANVHQQLDNDEEHSSIESTDAGERDTRHVEKTGEKYPSASGGATGTTKTQVDKTDCVDVESEIEKCGFANENGESNGTGNHGTTSNVNGSKKRAQWMKPPKKKKNRKK